MSVIVFLENGGATVLRNVSNRLSHNTEIQDWQSDKNIHILEKGSGVIKSRRIRWAGFIVRTREMRNIHRLLVGRPRERDVLEDRDVDGEILKLI